MPTNCVGEFHGKMSRLLKWAAAVIVGHLSRVDGNHSGPPRADQTTSGECHHSPLDYRKIHSEAVANANRAQVMINFPIHVLDRKESGILEG